MTLGAEQLAVQVWDDDGGRTPSEKAGSEIRCRNSEIASKARHLGKKAVRLVRRHPLQIFAGALVLGFVMKRVRR